MTPPQLEFECDCARHVPHESIDKRYALDEARAAIAYQRAGHVAGKVVVVVVPDDA